MSNPRPSFRSATGCCICSTKSSTSRFTSSHRYEEHFTKCFRVEDRSGDICNACVLVVKRFKVRESGDNRDWRHVVDNRCNKRRRKLTYLNRQQTATSGRPALPVRKIIPKHKYVPKCLQTVQHDSDDNNSTDDKSTATFRHNTPNIESSLYYSQHPNTFYGEQQPYPRLLPQTSSKVPSSSSSSPSCMSLTSSRSVSPTIMRNAYPTPVTTPELSYDNSNASHDELEDALYAGYDNEQIYLEQLKSLAVRLESHPSLINNDHDNNRDTDNNSEEVPVAPMVSRTDITLPPTISGAMRRKTGRRVRQLPEASSTAHELTDSSYWTMNETCCGHVWVGHCSDVLLVRGQYKPCCRSSHHRHPISDSPLPEENNNNTSTTDTYDIMASDLKALDNKKMLERELYFLSDAAGATPKNRERLSNCLNCNNYSDNALTVLTKRSNTLCHQQPPRIKAKLAGYQCDQYLSDAWDAVNEKDYYVEEENEDNSQKENYCTESFKRVTKGSNIITVSKLDALGALDLTT